MILKLFHFTTLIDLPEILRDGITMGEVPLGPYKCEDAANLTRNGEPQSQGWSNQGNPLQIKGRGIPFQRSLPPPPQLRVGLDVETQPLAQESIAQSHTEIGGGHRRLDPGTKTDRAAWELL